MLSPLRMMSLILFLDRHLWLYRSLCGAGLAATGYLAILPQLQAGGPPPGRAGRSGWERPALFLLALVATLFVFRYPIFFYPHYLNQDEAQMLAQAITYQAHAIPWVDVDGGSGGPLDSYLLLWCVPLGITPTYLTGRLIGLCCVAGLLVFLYGTGRRLAGEALARLAILPVFLFLAFTSMPDLVHYTGEHLSLFLLGWSLFLLSGLRRTPDSIPLSLTLGLILGMLPFAKLQSALPGAFLGLTAVAILTTRGRPGPAACARRLGPLLVGAAIPGALILSVVAKAGGLHTFWQEYITVAGVYLGNKAALVPPSRLNAIKVLILNRGLQSAFPIYLTGTFVLFAAIHLLRERPRLSRPLLQKSAFAALFFGVMAVTVFFPGKPFAHYLLYLMVALPPLLAMALRISARDLVHPTPRTAPVFFRETRTLLWIVAGEIAFLLFPMPHGKEAAPDAPSPYVVIPLVGLALLLLWDRFLLARNLRLHTAGAAAFDPERWRRRLSRTLFTALYLGAALGLALCPDIFPGHIRSFVNHRLTAVDQTLLRLRPPGGRLAVWGNQPDYFAETATPSGVRACAAAYTVLPSPTQDFGRAAFLEDMKKNRPEIFIDAVWPGSQFCPDPVHDDIQSFPALAALIAEDYRPADVVDGIRFFVRKDLPETPASPAPSGKQ